MKYDFQTMKQILQKDFDDVLASYPTDMSELRSRIPVDGRIIKPVFDALTESGEDFRMLILPDHPTPIEVRTHTAEPIPYMLYDSTDKKESDLKYCEKDAKKSGNMCDEGYKLMNYFLS